MEKGKIGGSFMIQLKLIGEKRALVAYLDGELDHHSATEVRTVLDKEIKRTNAVNIIFDFRAVTFMDSSGIGVIMGRYRLVQILGGHVILSGCNEQIRRIIEMSGMDKIVGLASSLDNALLLI